MIKRKVDRFSVTHQSKQEISEITESYENQVSTIERNFKNRYKMTKKAAAKIDKKAENLAAHLMNFDYESDSSSESDDRKENENINVEDSVLKLGKMLNKMNHEDIKSAEKEIVSEMKGMRKISLSYKKSLINNEKKQIENSKILIRINNEIASMQNKKAEKNHQKFQPRNLKENTLSFETVAFFGKNKNWKIHPKNNSVRYISLSSDSAVSFSQHLSNHGLYSYLGPFKKNTERQFLSVDLTKNIAQEQRKFARKVINYYFIRQSATCTWHGRLCAKYMFLRKL